MKQIDLEILDETIEDMESTIKVQQHEVDQLKASVNNLRKFRSEQRDVWSGVRFMCDGVNIQPHFYFVCEVDGLPAFIIGEKKIMPHEPSWNRYSAFDVTEAASFLRSRPDILQAVAEFRRKRDEGVKLPDGAIAHGYGLHRISTDSKLEAGMQIGTPGGKLRVIEHAVGDYVIAMPVMRNENTQPRLYTKQKLAHDGFSIYYAPPQRTPPPSSAKETRTASRPWTWHEGPNEGVARNRVTKEFVRWRRDIDVLDSFLVCNTSCSQTGDSIARDFMSAKELHEHFEQLDGTPCGVTLAAGGAARGGGNGH